MNLQTWHARRRARQQWDRCGRSGCRGALCVTAVLVAAVEVVVTVWPHGVCQETFEDTYLKRCSPVWHLARCGFSVGACGCGMACGSGDGLPVAVVWPCLWLCLGCPVTVTVAVAVCACGGARASVCVCVSLVCVPLVCVPLVCVPLVCVPLRLRVCLRTGIRLRLCLRVCLGRIRRVSCPLRTPGRPRAGAVTHSAQARSAHARHTVGMHWARWARWTRKANPQGKSTRQIHKANPWGREGDFIFTFLIRFSHTL